LEDGGFADAGGEGGEVGSKGGGEVGGGGGDFVAEAMEVPLRGSDGTRVEKASEPEIELRVVRACGGIAEKGE
jgi:hypothetical protein